MWNLHRTSARAAGRGASGEAPFARLIRLITAAIALPLLLAACASKEPAASAEPARPAWMPAPMTSLAYSSRVGIMTVLDNEIVHVTSGTLGLGGGREVLPSRIDLPGYAAESLRKTLLAKTPYQPVMVRPTARLWRDRATWQENWDKRRENFGDYQQEFDAIMKQNRLKMLIVISSPEEDDGIVASGQDLIGSGFYSRSFFGKKQTAVFSTMHFYRISGEPGKLQLPVSAPNERLYADIPNMPNPIPDPLPAPVINAVYRAVQNLIDQKTEAFVLMMK